MPTSERRSVNDGLIADDRGAIMVLGIFMCTCLVGALWYLAGIGDAILYRERVQEAADAVAFTDAAFHARGMNILVLLNLIMACVLGIRVAMKVGQFVLAVAAVAFTGMGFLAPAFWALVPLCLVGIQTLEGAIQTTREPINKALDALSMAEDAVSKATHPAAEASTSLMAGDKYKPVVRDTGVTDYHGDELPVTKGSQDKLCKEAGRFVGFLVPWMFRKIGLDVGDEPPTDSGDPLGWLSNLVGELAHTSPQFFCEIGSVGNEPNVDSIFEQSARDRCWDQPEAERKHYEHSESEWQKACAKCGVVCKGENEQHVPLDHGVQTGALASGCKQEDLDRLKLERDQDARSMREYKERFKDEWGGYSNECKEWAKDDMKRRQQEQQDLRSKQQPNASNTKTGSSSGAKPVRLTDDFRNGAKEAQILGGALGDGDRLQYAPRLVRLGAWDRRRAASESDGAGMPAWAQAEFFYDCGDRWEECNKDEDAMWHFQWRARLRRFNEPEPLSSAVRSMGLGSGIGLSRYHEAIERATTSPPGVYPPNAALREELQRTLSDRQTRARGVH